MPKIPTSNPHPQYNGWDGEGNYRRHLPPGSSSRWDKWIYEPALHFSHVKVINDK